MKIPINEAIITLAQITGFRPEKTGDGWKAICPAHVDDKPSLSIKGGRNGQAVCHCFAGCDWREIEQRLLDKNSLTKWTKPESERKSKLIAKYVYRDEKGRPVMRKLRFEPKAFAIQAWTGREWEGGRGILDGMRPILYNLPKLIKAKTIFILEGEKAVDRIGKWGLVGTCIYNGASKSTENPKWIPELYNKYFAGKHVILLPDNDEPGKVQMQVVAKSIHSLTASLKIIHLPVAKKADFYDWAEVGHTIEDLRRLWSETNHYCPE